MAKILDRDPVTYTKERDGFLRDLQHFHETRGTPFRRAPSINGHEIDLYLLYCLVTSQGGWIKVNSKNEWPQLFQQFCLPDKCINAGVGLKQLYLRYLDRWEKVHFLGEEADRGSDDDEESRHKRWSARALHSVPLSYNYQQHNIAESAREYNNLATDIYKQSDYDRLALSLIAPLPNEQDFAINVCTLLSNDGRHTLKLEKYPRIVDNLIAHTGIYNHSSLRTLFTYYYDKVRKHPLNTFWKAVLDKEEFLDLTNENRFVKSQVNNIKFSTSDSGDSKLVPSRDTSLVKADDILAVCESLTLKCTNEKDVNSDIDIVLNDSDSNVSCDSSDKTLFNLGRTLGTQDYVGQRVLQVATILRNLSFIEENVSVLARNCTFVRFIILCSNSRWAHLHNLGLDMLGNVSTEYLVKDLQSDRISECLLQLVSNGLKSEDRTFCIASLDALNKLSQTEANEEVLARSLETCVFQKVCSFLTLHDVMLLVYTLECLYSLSSLGERPCNLIVNIHGVIDTLVSLVTVEGKSYGPKACIGMKLVETVPGGSTASSAAQSSTSNSTSATTASNTSTTTTTSTTSTSSTSTTQLTPAKAVLSATPTRPIQITPQRVIISASTVTSTPTTTTTQVTQLITPQQLVQQQHAHQQAIQENEQFALTWLRATYEPQNNSRVDHQELYKHYINSCAKIGRRGVIAPLHFPRCVRSVFGGTVGPNPLKTVNVAEAQYYEGIKVRAQPLVISVQSISNLSTTQSPIKGGVRRKGQNITIAPAPTSVPSTILVPDSTDTPPPSPASPILKAQLSAPSKSRESTVVTPSSKGDMKSQVMAHPHLSQALLGNSNNSPATAGTSKEPQTGQSNTSLIKSLLATKVNDCMTPVSMKSSMDCQNVVQVAARQQQQRLLAQQSPVNSKSQLRPLEVAKNSRLNGARQLFSDDITDSSVSSTTVGSSFGTGKREPPQPPPPPLAPLSNNRGVLARVENDDSNSTGNNSLASSSGINLGISSTEDGDNSLTSFEGLLNGVPNMDNSLVTNDDSNSKDSLKSVIISKNKPLMLADLLEKKVDKDLPTLNGMIGKELRIGERGLELVENHIEKALSKDFDDNNKTATDTIHNSSNIIKTESMEVDIKQSLKRSAVDDISEIDVKRQHLSTGNALNGNADSPAPDSVSSSSNGDEPTGTVSTAAAKLFADIAADILEDEEEELLQEAQGQHRVEDSGVVQMIQNNPVQQVYMDQTQPQMIVAAQPRQILVTQPTMATNQVVLPAGTQLKAGQTVIVQNTGQQRPQMVLQQANTGQFLLSQGIQGQMQLVASTTQPGQYVLQTGGAQGTYVVAQSQTAVVHGQPQTVLVAQTTQQQGTGTKTIIILQQPTPGAATHHQKVMVTPQGQQVVVTQVQRPMIQTATSINNIVPMSTVIKTTTSPVVSQTVASTSVTTTIMEKKVEEPKVPPKPSILRDVSTPFICEWGECQIDTKFKSANQVYMHVCAVHCPESIDELTCQWERCDNMKRKRFSLMTHVYDKHCNIEAMKQSQIKRKQQSQSGKAEPPTPAPATPHPGYAPDAALHAIKRHALEFVNPKELQQRTVKQGPVTVTATVPRTGPSSVEQDDNEGPVTKSIRLTAALILRNLVIYSNNCKRYLRHYEPHLSNVALSNVESSRTVAQILYDMSDGVNHR